MKKHFAIFFVFAILLNLFSVAPLAEPISFEISNVDLPVKVGQVVVCTTLENWENCNPYWSNNLQCTPCGDNVYEVILASKTPIDLINQGVATDVIEAAGFTDAEGDIYFILHGDEETGDCLQFDVGVGMYVYLTDISAGSIAYFSDDPNFNIPDADYTSTESSDEYYDETSEDISNSDANGNQEYDESQLKKGDINNNEVIDSLDYLFLKRAYFKQYALADVSVGDINNNGIIDSLDYMYLKRAYFKQYVIK